MSEFEDILAAHRLVPAFDEYIDPAGEVPEGVPGTETEVCESKNHYFEMALVHDGECDVRRLARVSLVEREWAARLDMERLARAAVEPYDVNPIMGRCRVCGEDGVVVGEIQDPEGLAAEYERTR